MTAALIDSLGGDAPVMDGQPVPSCFHLTAVDDLSTGELLVELRQLPEAYDKRSPAHVVCRFIRENWEQIVSVAVHEAQIAERLAAQAPMQNRSLVMPASQRPGDVLYAPALVSGGSSVIQVDNAGVASQG